MTLLRRLILVMGTLALVLLVVSSVLYSSACVGPGTQTATLNLCLPAGGDNSWGADLRNNFTELSNLFTALAAQGGHTHNGSAGHGPKIGATSFDCIDSPTSGEVLVYNSGAGQCEWGTVGSAAVDQSANYNWSGRHTWSQNETDDFPPIRIVMSGDKGAGGGWGVIGGIDTSQGSGRGTFLSLQGGLLWSGIYNVITIIADSSDPEDFFEGWLDNQSAEYLDFGIVTGGLTTRRTIRWPDRSGNPNVPLFLDLTIDSNGTGSAADVDYSPTDLGADVQGTIYADILCNDPDGCNVDLQASGVARGTTLHFILQDTGPWTFENGSSLRLAGNTDFTTGNADDVLTLIFSQTRWREAGRSIN